MKLFSAIVFSLIILSCYSQSNTRSQSAISEEGMSISAKRTVPKYIEPIVVGDLQYSVSMNEIVATDRLSDRVIWKKEIYEIIYDEDLESDVQDVFIDSISLANSSLLIRNELGEFYYLNINSKEVVSVAANSKTTSQNGYTLIISESTQQQFDSQDATDSASKLLTEKQCIQEGIVKINALKEFSLKLSNGDFFTLKNDNSDEQFSGYSFIHYDVKRNIYVLWENWLEAGHPIMINGLNGEETKIFGKTFCSNKNQTLTANFAEDIDSGWTPNGIQLFEIKNERYKKLFDFNPSELLNEVWGPVGLKWKDDSTLLIECIAIHPNGGYLTLYKKLQFKSQ